MTRVRFGPRVPTTVLGAGTVALIWLAVVSPVFASPVALEYEIETPRVLSHVRALAESITSRYVDTEGSKRAAEYIRAELTKLDLRAESYPVGQQQQPGVALGSMVYMRPRTFSVQDENIVVRIPGVGPDADSKAILLMAHYDTVRPSPGAVDNAASVGLLLELARVLKEQPPARPVILAWTAAEEERLAGARALAQSRLARSVGLALSLDMVGSRGALTLNGLSSLIGKSWLRWIAGVA
jgi:acetylornithine deacetylase/succinyl-diaminopimelate desuccinylase-like protein